MEAILFLQDALVLDQLIYAAGAALTRGRERGLPAGIEVSSYSGPQIHAIAPEWRALEAQQPDAGTVFQSCDLILAWERHFADARNELRVVTVRRRGELVLVWPLAVETRPFGRIACWAGDPIGQYGDVIAADGPAREEWIEAAFAEIGRQEDIGFLCLRGLRADSAIGAWAARRGIALGPAAETPVLDTTAYDDLDGFMAEDWPLARRNAKRMRKFETMGGMSFEIVGPGPEAAALVQKAFAFKREWLAARGLYGRAFTDNRMEECLAGFAGDASASSGLAISHLSVGGETAAIEIGFRRGGRHYAYMGTFAPDFAKHSPGFVVTELTIRDCVAQGIAEYDPMPPADEYKLAWSNARIAVHDYGIVLGWSGYLSLAIAAWARPAAKRLFERLPLKIRRKLRK
ncbi:MAG: GNAT family N-acetyltransferase [Parvibaculum sp.]|nr:GNAT family N-acetyltransferase [Parvibaculum sp.]